jgi:transcriptional antiterminator NusG
MVQIREGPFKNVEGYVEEVNPASGKVKVMINIFNRATPVELEYWQVQPV